MARPVALALVCALGLGCGVTYSASYEHPITTDVQPDRWYDDAPPPDVATLTPETVLDASVAVDAAVEDTAPPPPVGEGPPYPIVLVHGFAGFQNIGPINYFFGVARDLRDSGNTVYEAETSPFLPPAQRAVMLSAFVDRAIRETHREKVILLAHSQGGLDARYLVSSLHYGDRVAAVVTVSTPHRGTRLADVFLGLIPGASDVLLNGIAAVFGMSYNRARGDTDLRAALLAMSETHIAAFNAQNPDDPRVVYWSYAGRSGRREGTAQCGDSVLPNDASRTDFANVLIAPMVAFLEQGNATAHVNDGLVEVQSARWGRFMGCVPADHFDEVGQIAHLLPDVISGYDHRAFYRDIVNRLRREGL